MITKDELAGWPEAKLRYPGADLISEEGHDEGEPCPAEEIPGGASVRRDAMVRRRWAFDADVDAICVWYRGRLEALNWMLLGRTTFEGTPIVIDVYERPRSVDATMYARPETYSLRFLSAEALASSEHYWPEDGSNPSLQLETTLVVPSASRRWYPMLTAEVRKDGRYLGVAEEWVGVIEFNAISDAAERDQLHELFRQGLQTRPEIDVSGAWDGEDEDCIRSREGFRWFMGSYLPSFGYDVILGE